MDPELKAYLDAWQARQQRSFDDHMARMARMDARLRPATTLCSIDLDTVGCVTGPVTASSDATEFVLASAGPAELPAPVPTTEKSPVVAPTVPVDTIAVAPATCSTECVAQVVSTTTTILLRASGSSSSSNASATNGVVSTELTPADDADEHGTLLDDTTVDVIPMLTEAAAGNGTLDGESIKGAASTAATSFLGSPSSNISALGCALIPAPWPPPLPMYLLQTIVAPVLNTRFGVPIMLSTMSTTEVSVVLLAASVRIPWASTRTWLESIPPRPPGPWSLFSGAWSRLRPTASITVQRQHKAIAVFKASLGPEQHSTGIPMQDLVLGSVLKIFRSGTAPSLLTADSMESGNNNQEGILGAYDCHVYKQKQKCMAREFRMRVVSVDFQLKIAWLSTFHAPVMKLQKLSYDCTASIGVHLKRTTVPTAEKSLAVTGAVPSDTTVVVHEFCPADCATQVVTAPSTTPATMPPPLLWASMSSSSHASSKPRPIPWPLFADRPGGGALGVSLDVSENFLQKPCAECEKAISSGLISKGNHHEVQHLDGSVSCCVHQNSFALFQLEIAWEIISGAFLKCDHYICCWYAQKPWSLLMCMVYTYWLLQGQVSMGVDVLDMQCLRYMILIHLAVATNLRVKLMELFPGDVASTRYSCAKFQCIIFWMSYCHHCSHMKYHGVEDYCLHSTKFSWELIQFVVATSHGKIISNQIVKSGLSIQRKQLLQQRVPACNCLTFQDEEYVMARTNNYLNHDGHSCYLNAFLDKIDIDHGYNQESFQGGRNAIFITTLFEQVLASDKYYTGASFDWVPANHDYCSYLVQSYPNFVYYCDSGQIKYRRRQWDPGGFLVMSAWGQAEFQGGRDVRNLFYCNMYLGWPPGPPHGPGPPHDLQVTYTWEEDSAQFIQRMDQNRRRHLLSHLGSHLPFPFLLVLVFSY